jgi:transcriptional regulator with XRE-family HTH domain
MNFGEFIKEKRLAKGINLRKLAELTGFAPGYLSDIEQGKRNSPTPEKLAKIIEVLELTEEDITLMNDLAAHSRETVAPDISEYVMNNDSVRVALRKARELQLGDKEWMKIIESMTKDDTEGN